MHTCPLLLSAAVSSARILIAHHGTDGRHGVPHDNPWANLMSAPHQRSDWQQAIAARLSRIALLLLFRHAAWIERIEAFVVRSRTNEADYCPTARTTRMVRSMLPLRPTCNLAAAGTTRIKHSD